MSGVPGAARAPDPPPWIRLVVAHLHSGVVRIQTDRGHTVCDSGPYRIVPHPGYAGSILSLPGIY